MKSRYCIFLLIIALILPSLVKADVAMPELSSYEAIVTNMNGASVYEREGDSFTQNGEVVPYNTKVYIKYEEASSEGIMATYVLSDDDSNWSKYILTKDISPLDGNIKVTYYTKSREYYAFKDTELRSGPSSAYDLVSVIPAGSIVKVVAFADNVWLKGSYNGKTGYIAALETYTYGDYSFALVNSNKDKILTTCNITEAYSVPGGDIISVNIPEGYEVVYDYVVNSQLYSIYGFKYEGTLYWVNGNYVAHSFSSYAFALSDTHVYRNYKDVSSLVDGVLKKGTLYNLSYFDNINGNSSSSWYRVKVDNDYYWILYDNFEFNDYSSSDVDVFQVKAEITYNSSVVTYTDSSFVTKKGSLNKGKYTIYLPYIGSSFYYVEGNGYVKALSSDKINILSNAVDDEFYSFELNEDTSNPKTTSSSNALIRIIIVVIIVAVIVVVLLVLISKKKGSKDDTTSNTSGTGGYVSTSDNNEE